MSEIFTSLGLMSGTSMDGIDLAIIQTDGKKRLIRSFPGTAQAYDADEQAALKVAVAQSAEMESREQVVERFSELEERITRKHSALVKNHLAKHKDVLPEIDLIGFHGQTVLHRPELGLTVQLGDGELLSELTGLPVVYDMRSNDMLNGGQGAPLAPAYHVALASNLPAEFGGSKPVAFVNIGGISNVTIVADDVVAFDTGPGNNLIDLWMQSREGQPFDEGGKLASGGAIDHDLVETFLDHSYFTVAPPKSLDRLDFDLPGSKLDSPDMVRSLAHITARCVIEAARFAPAFPMLWIVSGGGTNNPSIMGDLRELAGTHGSKVVTADEAGFSSEGMEAEAWAYLAVRAKEKLPLTYPKTTGCSHPVSGGRFANVKIL